MPESEMVTDPEKVIARLLHGRENTQSWGATSAYDRELWHDRAKKFISDLATKKLVICNAPGCGEGT